MTRQKIVIVVALVGIALFAMSSKMWTQYQANSENTSSVESSLLERPYSPSFGPDNAKVTIVEFFDPSCEACRAFYPFIKQILSENQEDVRLVLRYTAFHAGSDEVIRILETARRQDVFLPVLETILARQPKWAVHGKPKLDLAWEAAEDAGLDVAQAKSVMQDIEITNVLQQDTADVKALGVERTPTFFVNGKSMAKFGSQELYDLVKSELAQ